jgi:hypothetical protein
MRVLLPLKKGLTSTNKSDLSLSQQVEFVEHLGSTSPFDAISETRAAEAFVSGDSLDLQEDLEFVSDCPSVLEQDIEAFAVASETWTQPERSNLLSTEEINCVLTTPPLQDSTLSTIGYNDLLSSHAVKPADRQKRKPSRASDSTGSTASCLKKIRPAISVNVKKGVDITDLPRMAGGTQKSDDNRRVSESSATAVAVVNGNEFYENDPASARGHSQSGSIQCIRDSQTEDQFFRALKQRGLEIRVQEGDGNCLFRAVSLQVYGDSTMHNEVRHQCLDFMVRVEGCDFVRCCDSSQLRLVQGQRTLFTICYR